MRLSEYSLEHILKWAFADDAVWRHHSVHRFYEALSNGGFTSRDNAYEWNDADNHAFAFRHKDSIVVCLEDQNMRYAFVSPAEKEVIDFMGGEFQIFRYYDMYNEEWEEEKLSKRITIKKAIIDANWVYKRYSDAFPNVRCPTRPSLEYLLENDFRAWNASAMYKYSERIPAYMCSSHFLRHDAGAVLAAFQQFEWTMEAFQHDHEKLFEDAFNPFKFTKPTKDTNQ